MTEPIEVEEARPEEGGMEATIAEVLNHGAVWMLCPYNSEHDAGYSEEWLACRAALERTGAKIQYFEGGDGCSIYVDGVWCAFGSCEPNAWKSAYKRFRQG